MKDVDRLDLLAQELGFVLKSKQREALELLPRGNASFWPVGLLDVDYLQRRSRISTEGKQPKFTKECFNRCCVLRISREIP